MIRHKTKLLSAAVLLLILTLSACSGGQSQPAASGSGPSASESQDTLDQSQDAAQREAALYIGTKENGFAEYILNYEGDLTPELLIQGIGDLTGWDMTLDQTVTMGKGGMSVCFSQTSALFAGPPEQQKSEFHMFDVEQLVHTLLDSVQKTLQMGFTGKGGNPDALDIYYCMAGDRPLDIPDIGRKWPLDRPYKW